MANFREILQLTADGMANPGVANKWDPCMVDFGGILQLTAGGMVNPGVANNGIHIWPMAIDRELCSSQQVVWPNQEWPIMGSMYGHRQGNTVLHRRWYGQSRSGQ